MTRPPAETLICDLPIGGPAYHSVPWAAVRTVDGAVWLTPQFPVSREQSCGTETARVQRREDGYHMTVQPGWEEEVPCVDAEFAGKGTQYSLPVTLHMPASKIMQDPRYQATRAVLEAKYHGMVPVSDEAIARMLAEMDAQ